MVERRDVISLLGSQFGAITLGAPTVHAEITQDGYMVQKLRFDASNGARINALFLPPSKTNAPALLYCHAHGNRYDIGTDELLFGRPALTGSYLSDLGSQGYAVLCLEMPCFGARSDQHEEATAKALLWHGEVLFGQMLAELHAGVTYLADHPMIDADRIGTIGISMGGTHSWWLSALDERVKAAVSMCSFSDLEMLIEGGGHQGHGNYMTVPGLLKLCSTGELSGLSAPRPLFHGVGLQDWSTPRGAFEKARLELEEAYGDAGHMLTFHVEEEIGHSETPEMRKAVLSFLKRHL